ncbi:MAG: hypothetical protein LBB21_06240 [Holosporaceae bacterium]|nr:hypothetical protein [Holosporaceae bacterium]
MFGLSELTEQIIGDCNGADKGLLLCIMYSENDNYTSNRGMESWLRDADCLSSEEFIDKIRGVQ